MNPVNLRGQRNRLIGGAVAVICLVAMGVVAFIAFSDTTEDRLDVLRGDPLVTAPLGGVASERVRESAGSSGAVLGIPTPSTIGRTFILDAGPIQPAIDRLAVAGRAAGWTLTLRDIVGYSGRKKIDGIDAELVIAGLEAEKTVWLEISAR